jgi:hypothetical protein
MPLNYHNDLTVEFVRSVLDYDPDTGIFIWRKHVRYNCDAGSEAGWIWRDYRNIQIKGKTYQAHRLAFLIMTGEWPTFEVDHIDLNPSNNIWTNLRSATRSENQMNRKVRSNNKSGYKGVSYCNTRKAWIAVLVVNRKTVWCGAHSTPEAAYDAYKKKAELFYSDFRLLP